LPGGPSKYLGEAYNNFSEVYMDKGEIDKAFVTLEMARQTYEDIDYPLGLCAYYAVLSYYYSHLHSPADNVKI
jgi:hypothetical protein